MSRECTTDQMMGLYARAGYGRGHTPSTHECDVMGLPTEGAGQDLGTIVNSLTDDQFERALRTATGIQRPREEQDRQPIESDGFNAFTAMIEAVELTIEQMPLIQLDTVNRGDIISKIMGGVSSIVRQGGMIVSQDDWKEAWADITNAVMNHSTRRVECNKSDEPPPPSEPDSGNPVA